MEEETLRSALQDGTSAAILQACMGKAQGAKAVAETLGIPPVTVYRHVRNLVESGLLEVERSAVTASGKPFDLYRATIESASLSISAQGLEVTWQKRIRASDRLHGLWKQMENRK